MQHLAESCRNRNTQHIGTDGRRMTSYGSTVAGSTNQDVEAAKDSYENIEAEIEGLKKDVKRLRDEAIKNEATRGHIAPQTEEELLIEKSLFSRGGRAQLSRGPPAEDSAAARLQRQHEAKNTENKAPVDNKPRADRLPSPCDFPVLGSGHSSSGVTSPTTSELQSRKQSYAHIATTGMMDALSHAYSPSHAKRADSKLSGSIAEDLISTASAVSRTKNASAAATQDSHASKDNKDSVIISSEIDTVEATSGGAFVGKATQSTSKDKPPKQAPRFAQPTQSFARRTGESLRKDSASVSPKQAADGLPARSVKTKGPNFETEKRATQRQQKRKSLPGDWFTTPDQHSNATSLEVVEKATHVSVAASQKSAPRPSAALSSPPENHHVAGAANTRDDTTSLKSKLNKAQSQQTQHKKSSSYMAPTAAAKQRNVATRSHEKSKRDASRQKTEEAKTHITHESQNVPSSSRPDTACSDNSSVQFILDRSTIDTKTSPAGQSNDAQRHSHTPRYSPGRFHTPGQVSSPTAAMSLKRADRSPSKIPRGSPHIERQTRQSRSRQEAVGSSRSDGLDALPEVANTTTKRRTSHGHLLTPIVACLDAKGLLNKSSTKNALIESYLQSNKAGGLGSPLDSQQDEAPDAAKRRSYPPFSPSAIGRENKHVKRVLAPHLRKSRDSSQASTSTDATLGPQSNMQLTPLGPSRNVSQVSGVSQGNPLNSAGLSPGLPQSTPSMPPPSRVSSLRATASEFKPMTPSSDDVGACDLESALEYKSPEQWSRMHPDLRRAIQNLRNFHKTGSWQPSHTLPSQSSSPWLAAKVVESHFSEGLMADAGNNMPYLGSVDDNGSPHSVQVGQVLKPTLSPGKKTVQWMLLNLDGKETPIKFGRAPAPHVSPVHEPSTPTISAASDSTSPLTTPHSLQGWQIGSAYSYNPYGWTGGDGKEIKFVGYGPHAERDPNTVVDFHFNGRTASYSTSTPNGFKDDDKENRPSEGRVAPRSQRQWAEKLGYHKVPCGNVEITHAVEQIPFGSQLAGYCHDCVAGK